MAQDEPQRISIVNDHRDRVLAWLDPSHSDWQTFRFSFPTESRALRINVQTRIQCRFEDLAISEIRLFRATTPESGRLLDLRREQSRYRPPRQAPDCAPPEPVAQSDTSPEPTPTPTPTPVPTPTPTATAVDLAGATTTP